MKFGLVSCALFSAYTIGSILQYRSVDVSHMKLSRTYRTRLRTPSSSVVKTLEVVHQLMRSPFQNEEAHRSVGMVCFADIFSLEVLSGFIVMFCRIWTQHLNFQELVGHSSCTSEFREWVARHDQRLCKYVLNICEAAKNNLAFRARSGWRDCSLFVEPILRCSGPEQRCKQVCAWAVSTTGIRAAFNGCGRQNGRRAICGIAVSMTRLTAGRCAGPVAQVDVQNCEEVTQRLAAQLDDIAVNMSLSTSWGGWDGAARPAPLLLMEDPRVIRTVLDFYIWTFAVLGFIYLPFPLLVVLCHQSLTSCAGPAWDLLCGICTILCSRALKARGAGDPPTLARTTWLSTTAKTGLSRGHRPRCCHKRSGSCGKIRCLEHLRVQRPAATLPGEMCLLHQRSATALEHRERMAEFQKCRPMQSCQAGYAD
eukprot:s679_g11.t2